MARRNQAQGTIDFEVIGDKNGVQAMLSVLDSSLSPAGLAAFLLGNVAPWVKERAQDRFEYEGDDVSGYWQPLTADTIEIRHNMGFFDPHMNRRTGELEQYITQSSSMVTTGPGWGTLKYPAQHARTKGLREKMKTAQAGKASPSTPPRPVLGLNERDLAYVLSTLAFFVQGKARSAGVIK